MSWLRSAATEAAPANGIWRRLRPGPVYGFALVLAIGIGVHGARPGGASPEPALTVQQVPTARDSVDLRCLTRRPEDCLREPVPTDEPHDAICSTCHSLWEGADGRHGLRDCRSAGCHVDVAQAVSFHRSLAQELLGDCVHCHPAHAFPVTDPVDGCLSCHVRGGAQVAWADRSSAAARANDVPFLHGDHRAVRCAACHGYREAHGAVTVTTLHACRSCHHNPPTSDDCMACHTYEEMAERVRPVEAVLDIRIGGLDAPVRVVSFAHRDHIGRECVTCHVGRTDLGGVGGADCSACHAGAHDASMNCAACHAQPRPGVHDLGVHLGCGGTGCHDEAPDGITSGPRVRQVCLVCHRDRTDHRPGEECAACHAVPAVEMTVTGFPR